MKFKFHSRFILYGSKLYIGYTSLLVDVSSRSNIYFDLFAFFQFYFYSSNLSSLLLHFLSNGFESEVHSINSEINPPICFSFSFCGNFSRCIDYITFSESNVQLLFISFENCCFFFEIISYNSFCFVLQFVEPVAL